MYRNNGSLRGSIDGDVYLRPEVRTLPNGRRLRMADIKPNDGSPCITAYIDETE